MYKKLTLILTMGVALAHSKSNGAVTITKGTLLDPRNNILYNTIKVNDKIWMAENLDFAYGNSYCYEDKTENCENYGRLYQWESAKNACPKDWHLPSRDEWLQLSSMLKNMSLADKSWYGDNLSGFGAFASGYKHFIDGFIKKGVEARFWSSSQFNNDNSWGVEVSNKSIGFSQQEAGNSNAFSVRCIKD